MHDEQNGGGGDLSQRLLVKLGLGRAEKQGAGEREAEENSDLSRRDLLVKMGLGAGLLLFPLGRLSASEAAEQGVEEAKSPSYDPSKHYWGYAIDTNRCIGCLACMRACRAENDVPEGYVRTWIERYTIDTNGRVMVDVAKDENVGFTPLAGGEAGAAAPAPVASAGAVHAAPQGHHGTAQGPAEISKAYFVPKMCNHCEKSVCNQVCPVGAAYRTKDGVVLIDDKRCVGCGYCVQACPYGSRFINPGPHIADKCTLCYHRITKGMLPACVQACPTGTRIFGDLNDPKSRISTILRQRRYRVLKPELGTHPKCYYIGLNGEVV